MKKKILHVLNSSSYSGAENVVITIINNMNDYYEFAYASKDGPINDVLSDQGIKFLPLKKLSVYEMNRVINNFKPDIIHAHDYTASIISAISNIKIPVISHLHNNAPWIKTLHPYSFAHLCSSLKYKKILTVSNSILDEYVFGNYIRKKTVVISNPINVKEIYRKSTESDVNMNYDIVFLGRLSEPKNPLKFIELMRMVVDEFPSLKVAMIGDGILKNSCEKKLLN